MSKAIEAIKLVESNLSYLPETVDGWMAEMPIEEFNKLCDNDTKLKEAVETIKQALTNPTENFYKAREIIKTLSDSYISCSDDESIVITQKQVMIIKQALETTKKVPMETIVTFEHTTPTAEEIVKEYSELIKLELLLARYDQMLTCKEYYKNHEDADVRKDLQKLRDLRKKYNIKDLNTYLGVDKQ